MRESKGNLKRAKRQLNEDYRQLKRDKLADKGKRLYQSGKTITSNQETLSLITGVASGTAFATSYLAKNGYKKYAGYTAAAGIGLTAVSSIFAAKNAVEARQLRAYYSHSRNR